MAQAKQHGTYPADWSALSKLVKDEAQWRCARCGLGCRPGTMAPGLSYGVHHFDGNRGNNARWNLMPTCNRCHLSVQGRVNPAVAILVDPRPWAMPYISGLYEAGGCIPSPTYDLSRWVGEYERAVGPWPHWAPRPVPQEGATYGPDVARNV